MTAPSPELVHAWGSVTQTACGLDAFRVLGDHVMMTSSPIVRVTDDPARVTCRRCIGAVTPCPRPEPGTPEQLRSTFDAYIEAERLLDRAWTAYRGLRGTYGEVNRAQLAAAEARANHLSAIAHVTSLGVH